MKVVSGHKSRCRNCDLPIIYFEVHSRQGSDKPLRNCWWHHQSDETECADGVQAAESAHVKYEARAEPVDLCMALANTSSFHSSRCYRKVKDEELGLCGIHARPVRQMAAKERELQEFYERQNAMKEGVQALIDELALYDIEAKLHLKRTSATDPFSPTMVTGDVIVDPAAIIRLCEQLEEQF